MSGQTCGPRTCDEAMAERGCAHHASASRSVGHVVARAYALAGSGRPNHSIRTPKVLAHSGIPGDVIADMRATQSATKCDARMDFKELDMIEQEPRNQMVSR